ncbi:MAG: hypothetical protein ACOC22_00380 [bacterium]
MIWLVLILIIIAGISNAIMDTLQFRYSRSIFSKFKNQQWWNPTLSWRNKWKNGDYSQGERFWGSSRWFVRFTDAWHFFQGLMFTCLFLAMVFYEKIFYTIIDFLLIYLLFTVVFQILFKFLSTK